MKIEKQLKDVLTASRKLNLVDEEKVKEVLLELAGKARKNSRFIIAENQRDLDRMDPLDPKFDRLKLTEERISGIAADIENVANLPSPVGRILKEDLRPNGLKITKISVPFGVIGIIYEARPNVTFDVFALCCHMNTFSFSCFIGFCCVIFKVVRRGINCGFAHKILIPDIIVFRWWLIS